MGGAGGSTTAAGEEPGAESPETARRFTRWQRLQIAVAAWIGTAAVGVLGRAGRWQIHGWEHFEAARARGQGIIFSFWHREITPATWLWRRRGIMVMTSQNFDGEYICRIIRRYGYEAARGSSSRGARRALLEMIRALHQGADCAFTVDGPRGPRFVVKHGAVTLARATGAAILCFHIQPHRSHVFTRSWDHFQIPYPFTRLGVFIAPPIVVERECSAQEEAEKLAEVQRTLEDLQRQGEAWSASL